jgi:hypothetical protein
VGTKTMCACACLLALASLAAAQESPGSTQSFHYDGSDLATALAGIGKLYGVRVLAEEGLRGSVTAKAANATIETALTMIAAPNRLAWRRFILAVNPTDEVTAKTLGDLMEALDTIRFSGLLMEGPQPENSVTVERAAPPEWPIGAPAPDGSRYTAYYYVYDPTPKPLEPKPAQEKRPGRVFGMPENPQQQMQQYRAWFGGLDPEMKRELIKQFMSEMLNAEGAIMLEVQGDDANDVRRRIAIRVRTDEDGGE